MEAENEQNRVIYERLLPCYQEKINFDCFNPNFNELIENIMYNIPFSSGF